MGNIVYLSIQRITIPFYSFFSFQCIDFVTSDEEKLLKFISFLRS